MKLNPVPFLSGIIACALTAAPLFAEPAKPDTGKMAEQRLEKMKTELNLTDDQVTKIKAIQDSKKSEIDAIRGDKSLSAEQRRERLKPVLTDMRKQTADVLTPEQRAKMKAGGKKPKDKPAAQ